MNALHVSSTDMIEDHVEGSDSDSNLDDDEIAPQYYQPISAVDDHHDDSDGDAGLHHSRPLPNGYRNPIEAENGVSSLRLNDDEDEEEEEEERIRAEADSAIARAFREDEDRRNAPFTAENAVRVMDAMRGVSFRGAAPEWAHRVSESDWVDQLRRLTQSTDRA